MERHGVIPLTAEAAAEAGKFDNVVSMTRQDHPTGYYDPYGKLALSSRTTRNIDWTEDNFGPIYIPKKGATMHADRTNLPLVRARDPRVRAQRP
jgi:signal peptidase I